MDSQAWMSLANEYGNLPEEELRTRVARVLMTPGYSNEPIVVAFRDYLVELSWQRLRPRSDETKRVATRRKEWLAFALRYLEPLCKGKLESNPCSTVANALKNSSQRLFVDLVFLDDKPCKVLETLFSNSNTSGNSGFTEEQKKFLNDLNQSSCNEGEISKWSLKLRAKLQDLVVVDLLTESDAQKARLYEASASLGGQAERERLFQLPAKQHKELFEQYYAASWEGDASALRSMAVANYFEHKRRVRVGHRFARCSKWAGVTAFFWLIANTGFSLGTFDLPYSGLQASQALVAMTGTVFLIFLIVYFYVLINNWTWGRAALFTFQILLEEKREICVASGFREPIKTV